MRTNRNGFTLIELMIAIIIVAMLAGMTVVGTRVAMKSAKAPATKMQIEQVSIALDKYKSQYGEYPPDFSDPIAVMRHVKLRWPRSKYEVSQAGFQVFCEEIRVVTGNISGVAWSFDNGTLYSPAAYVSPLVFWLGGLPDTTGKPAGFSLSPTDPIGISGIAQREAPFFAFPDETVENFNGLPVFYPQKSKKWPLVYFAASDNKFDGSTPQTITATAMGEYALPLGSNSYSADQTKYYDFTSLNSELGVAFPYARDTQTKNTGTVTDNCPVWYEADRFQLIYPGEDGSFGVNANGATALIPPHFPRSLTNMTKEEMDNITNFTEGSTLESEKVEE